MKFVAILLVCTLGWASSASTPSMFGCAACKNTVDWMRMNENALTTMKSDEQFNEQFIELLTSDESAEDICGRLSMCETADDFMNSFRGGIGRGGGRGGRGGGFPHGGGHGGGDSPLCQIMRC